MVDPVPVAKTADVVAVALYPYEVGAEYGVDTAPPVPPDTVALRPNDSVPGVDEAKEAPIAVRVLSGFCCDVIV